MLLIVAALLCGAAAGGGLLPWHSEESFGERETIPGYLLVEGILELVLGGLGTALFLAVQARISPAARRRIAGTAVILAFGAAAAPLALIVRGSWLGVRSVVILGVGYSGWSYGLYLSLIAGFLSAGFGSVGASALLVSANSPSIARRRPRRETRP